MADLSGLSPSGFRFGPTSLENMIGVHPRLVRTVRVALSLSRQDFQVHDGVRSRAEQQVLVARGASRTLLSRHLLQSDGWGHAADLVPWIDGGLSWSWPACLEVAAAMRAAAELSATRLRWGGVWDRPLDQLGPSADDLRLAVRAYVQHRRRAGRPAFTDAPHFELIE